MDYYDDYEDYGESLLGGCYGCPMCGGVLNLSTLAKNTPGYSANPGELTMQDLMNARNYHMVAARSDTIDKKTKKFHKEMLNKIENVLDQMGAGRGYAAQALKKDAGIPNPDLYAVIQGVQRKKRATTTKPKARKRKTGECDIRTTVNGKIQRRYNGKLVNKADYERLCGNVAQQPMIIPGCTAKNDSRGYLQLRYNGKLVDADTFAKRCGSFANYGAVPYVPKKKNKKSKNAQPLITF